MNKNKLINKLIKGSLRRAIQESAAALLVITFYVHELQHATVGSPQYYGCLIILISAGFIAGVVWSFALSYRLLRTHPVSDSVFWHEAFHAQARLLRFVPLWYLTPICSGLLLISAPATDSRFSGFLIQLFTIALVFGSLTWLNRAGAAKIEADALTLSA